MFDRSPANTENLKPAIICTADLSYYLIGAEDASGKFYNIYSNDMKQPLYAQSLEQAKRMLKTKLSAYGSSHQVIVEMANPYDEMIGSESYGPSRMVIQLTCEQ